MKSDKERLLEYVFGDMTKGDHQEVTQRIQVDPAWRVEYEKLLRMKSLLESDRERVAEPVVPYGYWERFNDRLVGRLHPAPSWRAPQWKQRWSWAAPAVALAALIVFFTTAVPTTSDRIDFVVQTETWLNSDTVADALTSYIESANLSQMTSEETVDGAYEENMSIDFSVDDVSLDILGDLEQLSSEEQENLLDLLKQEDII